MTDKIQQFIDEITRKSRSLHHQLVEERMKNEQLRTEIVNLQEQLMANSGQIESQSLEITKLKGELEAAKLQVIEEPIVSDHRKEEEIDELVKEIEYCISQLKK
jgi:predicted transcriptional regulator